jgi:hypothetical protein
LVAASLALTACGSSDGLASATAACVKVEHGLALEARAQSPNTPASARASLHAAAMAAVLSATGDAARATSANGGWNALMTSISQASDVPLSDLVATLSLQCRDVASGASS